MSEIKVNSIKGVGASTAAITVNNTDGTCSANLTNNIHNKNVLINSNFAVNQRGTFTANTDEYTIDRWYHNTSGATSTITQETHTVGTEIEGQANYLKMVVSSSSDYAGIRYRHEDVKTITPGVWTLSFWAKGTTPTGGLKIWCTQDFGNSGSSDVDIANQTLTALTNTWTRQSITITVPSFSGKTINAASFFQFTIGQYDAGSAAWELNIANVQFEQGSILTDYEPPRSFADELQRCKRYFQIVARHHSNGADFFALGSAYGTSQPEVIIKWETEMRAAPSLEIASGTNYYQFSNAGNQLNFNNFQIWQPTIRSALLFKSGGPTTTNGMVYRATTNDANAYIYVTAEL